jgi:hypothetical protein
MSKKLDDIAKRIADEQAELEGSGETTRQRVLRIGRELQAAQKEQKAEQAETGQTWKEWCAEQKGTRSPFPEYTSIRQYMLIAKYPAAYKPNMSIKEAYKEAGKWKKNGGKEPPKEKVTIVSRPLVTIAAMCGKLEKKIEATIEIDISQLSGKECWDDDEVTGAVEALTMVRQASNALLRKLRDLEPGLENGGDR